jgi:ubiquitin C-terminal hydrolase
MPSRFANMKRNAPIDFEDSERPVKMMRGDHTPTPVRDFAMIGAPAPVTAPSPSKAAVKRKYGALDTTNTSQKGCRGGKKSAKRPKCAIVDASNEDATGGSTSSPSVDKDTAEVSASTEGDAAAKISEDAVKAEDENGKVNEEVTTADISSPSAGEGTAEVPVTTEGDAEVTTIDKGNNEATISSPSAAEGTAKVPTATKEDALATASELAEALFDAFVGEDTAELPTSTEGDAAVVATECAVKAEDDTDAPGDQKTVGVSPSPKEDAVATTSECAAEAKNDSNNSSEPMSSSRKSVSGSIESADSSSSSESASSSQKSANRSSETLDTIVSVSEPEEAPKKPTSKAAKKERYITGLYNHGNQCFANATLQFFDAALDGHDLDLLLGKDEDEEQFHTPKVTSDDKDKEENKAVTWISTLKTGIRKRIQKFRSGGMLKHISPRRHLRTLLSRMRGSKDTAKPVAVAPIVFHQMLAFGGEDATFEHLDGTTQEDCYEYFGALMNGATSTTVEESDADGAESAAKLKNLFAMKSEVTKVCDCGWKGPVQAETNEAVSTSVWKSRKTLGLKDMLHASSKSILEDQKCPKCGEETLADVTELKEASENFVVHINRVEGYGIQKLQTLVELPLGPIEFCGKDFMLNAVVKHKGYTVDFGHYTVLRRRSSEWMTDDKSLWYQINDESVKAINKSDVRDFWKGGHSAMLLFKAV